jgi:energy-coupling factor transport system ATP-binding protein
VSYTYSSHEGSVEALNNVSLTLEEGELLGIIGHTGSGKSTLLQLMCGLLAPTTGSVVFDGENLRDKKVQRSLFTKVGIAFQYPEQQLFAKTIADDVAFAPRNAGLSNAEVDKRVREALATMHLDYKRYAEKSPFELSGGEMRRVALAGVIAARPQLLILDEPAAGLDPAGRSELIAIIEAYHRSGATMVLVSHDMDNIARLSDKVLVLKDGQVAFFGTPAEVFSHPKELRAMNLGVPRATTFAAELRELGVSLPEGLLTIEALAEALAGAIAETHKKSPPADTTSAPVGNGSKLLRPKEIEAQNGL